MGYHIEIIVKKGNRDVGGDGVDVQHNWFITNLGNDRLPHYVYDANRVYGLSLGGGGDDVQVTWQVTVIKSPGGFDNKTSKALGTTVNCSPPSGFYSLKLIVLPPS